MTAAYLPTPTPDLPVSADAVRLAGKAERRARIVEAARALIREHGEAGFTMSALARRAGVSPATPYNLVGPRSRVIEAIVEAEFEAFRHRLSLIDAAQGVAGVMTAIMLITDHYVAEPRFYRGLYRAMVAAGGEDLRRQMSVNGLDFWTALVAKAEPELDARIALEPITNHLLQVITSVTLAWVVEDWTPDRFRAEMHYAAGLVFAGVVKPERRAALLDDLSVAQDKVLALQAGPATSP